MTDNPTAMHLCANPDFPEPLFTDYCSACNQNISTYYKKQLKEWMCLALMNESVWLNTDNYWRRLNNSWKKILGTSTDLAGGRTKLWFCPNCSRDLRRHASKEYRSLDEYSQGKKESNDSHFSYDALLQIEIIEAISTARKNWNVKTHLRNVVGSLTQKKHRVI